MAEHRSILENYENTHYPHFSFMPETGIAFPKMRVLYLLCTVLKLSADWRKISMSILVKTRISMHVFRL